MSRPSEVFLDANLYFAAFAFPEGLCSVLLGLARKGELLISTTPLILKEADQNLKRHADPAARLEFHRFLQTVKIRVKPDPSPKEVKHYSTRLGIQDAHVLAAALTSGAMLFLTLDRRNFLNRTVLSSKDYLRIATPREILET